MGPDGQDHGEKTRNIEKYAKRTAEQGDDPGDRRPYSRYISPEHAPQLHKLAEENGILQRKYNVRCHR